MVNHVPNEEEIVNDVPLHVIPAGLHVIPAGIEDQQEERLATAVDSLLESRVIVNRESYTWPPHGSNT
ncbi:hypothetical protein AMTR_s00042p00076170 [Amborella trichopoda]|uniref:Uncharacterized protein n=1 Tax=Amborella trichopoda TaxID=13333 RepID=W1P7J8_AMBTC|nr:hypothetical protein AMTR_s00042p00076170 [Amborella trichopoda]